jgi:hypothetical protein
MIKRSQFGFVRLSRESLSSELIVANRVSPMSDELGDMNALQESFLYEIDIASSMSHLCFLCKG